MPRRSLAHTFLVLIAACGLVAGCLPGEKIMERLMYEFPKLQSLSLDRAGDTLVVAGGGVQDDARGRYQAMRICRAAIRLTWGWGIAHVEVSGLGEPTLLARCSR